MAKTLDAIIKASLGWTYTDDPGGDGLLFRDSNEQPYKESLTSGQDANEADTVWHDERTLASGASETLDLENLIWDLLGNTVYQTLSRVKAILIVNESTADSLRVGNAASNAWVGPFGAAAHTVEVPPDSPLLLVNLQDGWQVNATSSDLKIANTGAGSITYQIVILGVGPLTSSSSSSS